MKLFARVGMEVDITENELKTLIACSTAGGVLRKANEDEYKKLERKAVEIARKHFGVVVVTQNRNVDPYYYPRLLCGNNNLDSYIPGCVIEELAIANGLHKNGDIYDDIDF